MFEKFENAYKLDFSVTPEKPTRYIEKADKQISGVLTFFEKYAGASFNKSFYRVHGVKQVKKWTKYLESIYREYKKNLFCFGYDWMGRQLAVNKNNGKVLIFNPVELEPIKTDKNFHDFHEIELTEKKEETFLKKLYNYWVSFEEEIPEYHECIGFSIPFFLEGSEAVENLEKFNLNFYWSLNEKIIKKARNNDVELRTTKEEYAHN